MTGSIGTIVSFFLILLLISYKFKHYMAPEILNNEPYSISADIFSLGVINFNYYLLINFIKDFNV